MRGSHVALGFLGAAALLLVIPHAMGATFTVDSLADTADAGVGPDGSCADVNAACTLRAALREAGSGGPHTIEFAVAGPILLRDDLPRPLVVGTSVTIMGGVHSGIPLVTVDGNGTVGACLAVQGHNATILGIAIRDCIGDGLRIDGVDHQIGEPGRGVHIFGGTADGIQLESTSARVTIQASKIGAPGNGNDGDGIKVAGSDHVIGAPLGTPAGDIAELGNCICGNGDAGVHLTSGADDITVRGNAIFDNDVQGGGLDAVQLVAGANDGLRTLDLDIDEAGRAPANLRFSITGGPASMTGLTVDFYGTTAGCDGFHHTTKAWLGSVTVATNGAGAAGPFVIGPLSMAGYAEVTAAVTLPGGSSSGNADCADVNPQGPTPTPGTSPTATPSPTPTPTPTPTEATLVKPTTVGEPDCPEAAGTPSATPTPSATATPTATPGGSPTPTATPTATPIQSPSPTPTPVVDEGDDRPNIPGWLLWLSIAGTAAALIAVLVLVVFYSRRTG